MNNTLYSSSQHNISCKTALAPSQNSDHPAHSRSLIRVFSVCLMTLWLPTECYAKTDQTCADAQTDLRLVGRTGNLVENLAVPWLICIYIYIFIYSNLQLFAGNG